MPNTTIGADAERAAFERWLAAKLPAGCVSDMERGWMAHAAITDAAQPDPRTPADMSVNGGALTLALNVLRRAGKNEVADELEKTAAPAAQEDALDTVRLNWLEGVEGRFYNIDRISAVVGTGFLTRTENGTAQISPTLRAAIDAARAAKKGAQP